LEAEAEERLYALQFEKPAKRTATNKQRGGMVESEQASAATVDFLKQQVKIKNSRIFIKFT